MQIDRKGHKTAKKINLQEHQDFGKDCENGVDVSAMS